MKILYVPGALLLLFVFCNYAVAEDLKGEWITVRGASHGALSGLADHGTRPEGDHFTQDVNFTLNITSREGNGFHGQWCSAKKCENVAGVIRRDKTMLMVDHDSTFFLTMYGGEMELCVTEHGEDLRMASCHIMAKK